MTNEEPRVRRTLQLRFTLPTADSAQLVAMIKAATPFYQMFGKAEVRLMQNVDDPTKFVQQIEYEANEDWELSRQRIAGEFDFDDAIGEVGTGEDGVAKTVGDVLSGGVGEAYCFAAFERDGVGLDVLGLKPGWIKIDVHGLARCKRGSQDQQY